MNKSTLPGGPRSRAATCALAAILSSSAPFAWAGGLPVIIDVDPCPQCRVVGPGGLSEITVTFDTDVNVTAASVRVRTRASMGANVGFMFSGTPGDDTFTIVLDEAVESDMVTVVIDYTITSVATDEALDGEMSDPRSLTLPSGDGLPGGQAVMQFAVLQGDVDGNGATNVIDLQLVLDPLNQGEVELCDCSLADPGNRLDVNGDGVVNSLDAGIVFDGLSLLLPQADGDAPMVIMLSPAGGETVCGELDTVTADFNQSLAPDTATATTLFALDPDGELQASSSATLGGNDDMIDYTFDPPLSINVDYDFTLSESIMDPSGELIDRTLFSVSTSEPTITGQPADTTATAGETVELSVVATGVEPLTYQWRKDEVDLTDETGATLTLSSVATGDTGDYDVIVTDANECLTFSAAATLTVNVAPGGGGGGGGGTLEIQTQPIDQSACEGDSVEFTVVATAGTGTLTYQWTRDGVEELIDGGNISGATSDTLTLDPVDAGDERTYEVTVSDDADMVTSDSAELTVNTEVPTITSQPTDQTVIEGGIATFSVTASDVCLTCYQWRMNGTDLLGAVTGTLTIPGADSLDAGDYDVEVTDGNGCSAVSDTVTLTVDTEPTPDDGVTIESHPASQTVCEEDGVTLSVTASGAADLTFQWSLNGVAIAGATGDALTINAAQIGDSGDYAVEVSSGNVSDTSDAATLTVAQSPTIVTSPANQTIDTGAAVSFSVTADGTAPLSYQWSVDGAIITGATGPTLILTSDEASSADGRVYQVTVTNVCGSATSLLATLTVGTGGGGDPTVGEPVPGDDSAGGGSPCGLFDIFGLIVLPLGLAGLRFGRSRRGY